MISLGECSSRKSIFFKKSFLPESLEARGYFHYFWHMKSGRWSNLSHLSILNSIPEEK